MRILVLQDNLPPQGAGAGIVAINLARAVKGNGHTVFIVTTVQDKKDEGEIEFEGLKLFKIYSNYHERWRAYLSLYNPQTVKKIKRIINDIKPDIVHAHNIHYYLSYHSLRLAKKNGAKVFLTAHDVMLFHYGKLTEFINQRNPSCEDKNYKISAWQQIKTYKKRYNPFRNMLIRYYLKYVNKIFTVSDALKEALNQNSINSVEVVHNGIDINEWQADESKIREFKEKYDLKNKKVVLFGGRLSVYKGGHQAILAMEKVAREIPEAVLLIMGGRSGYAEEMAKEAQDLGIGKNLAFTRWIEKEELKAAYFVSGVVLFPSVYLEPFGLINLEAMVCAKPVVATCFGGTPEIVQDEITGYIVNPLNVELLADRVTKILSDSDLAKQMGDAGYNRVKNSFTLQKQADEYLREFTVS